MRARVLWARTPEEEKQARLDTVLKMTGLWDEAAALLSDIQNDGYKISFDSNLYTQKNGYLTQASIDLEDKTITLSPFTDDGTLVVSLLHECRHYWQEKNWGAKLPQLREMHPDRVRDHIFVRRVLEADAQAFASLGVYVLNIFSEGAEIVFNKINAQPLDGDQEIPAEVKLKARKALNEYLIDKTSPAEMQERMKAAFFRNLKYYDNYDAQSLRAHHVTWIAPLEEAQERTPPDFKALRGLLRAGTRDTAPSYMDGVTDKELAIAVLEHITPDTRRTMKLMDRFRAAGAKGQKPDTEKQKHLQQQIKSRLTPSL
jgi:hypothetical protein